MTSSKHQYAKDDRFAPNFGKINETIQPFSVLNLKSFGPMKTDLWAKEVEEVSIMM